MKYIEHKIERDSKHAASTITEIIEEGNMTRDEEMAFGYDAKCGFYFWNEAECDAYGPYRDVDEAVTQRNEYFKNL
jgi:hypothetical protein